MPNCSFCEKKIETGTGMMFVKATGKVFWFCSKKCEKNYNMGRVSKKMNWIRKEKK